MLKLLLSFILLLLIGCSGAVLKNFFGNTDDATERNAELLKDFETEKDVMAKFAVKPKEIPTVPVIEKKNSKIEKIKPKKISKVKTKKRVAVQKQKPKKQIVVVAKKQKTKKFKYPENYPERFKDYDYESEKFWDKYQSFLIPGEKATFAIKYGIISTGNIVIETKPETRIGEHEVYHIQARVKTSDYYSYLYELDDLCDSYIKKDGFYPLKFSLIQRESSQNIDDLQLFDLDKRKTYSFYKRVTDKKTKKAKKENYIPLHFQDPLSIMYFIRGLPMDKETEYVIPISNKGQIEILTAQFEKIETLSTKIGEREAYKVNIISGMKGETINGGKMTFWFAKDETRIFLKFKAKIKIGSISGDILEYKR